MTNNKLLAAALAGVIAAVSPLAALASDHENKSEANGCKATNSCKGEANKCPTSTEKPAEGEKKAEDEKKEEEKGE